MTPFDSAETLAPQILAPVIDRAINAGVPILTANGNTGESYSLTTPEAERMVHSVAELIDGRVSLVGGVAHSIADSLTLARASREAEAAALMVHQPPDPFVAPRGMLTYVQRIAETARHRRSYSISATTRSGWTLSNSLAKFQA